MKTQLHQSILSTPITKAVAVVTFESHFFAWGGIPPVLSRLPHFIELVSGLPTFCIAPWFPASASLADAEKAGRAELLAEITVPFEGEEVALAVLRIMEEKPLPQTWILLRPTGGGFFSGKRSPYDVDSDTLLRDALFFGAAAAHSLRILAPHAQWNVSLHDWEAGTTALALRASPDIDARSWLTLHNVIGDPSVDNAELRHASIEPSLCAGPLGTNRGTILERILPLVQHDVFIVSRQFAEDIFNETLLSVVLASHLQRALAGRVVGADNGPFTSLTVPRQIIDAAGGGDSVPLFRWKAEQRKRFFKALDALDQGSRDQIVGDPKKFSRDERTVLIVCGGRDCASQKGFETVAAAARSCLALDSDVQFIFFPMPEEGMATLDFLQELASDYPENVLVLPFKHREAYEAALRAASFVCQVSWFEPFGAASEAPLNGSVPIVRGCGGLLEQVVPLRSAQSTTASVLARSQRWHAASHPATGYIVFEDEQLSRDADAWRAINNHVGPGRLQARQKLPLFNSLVQSLDTALVDAATTWRNDPVTYGRLVAAGVELAEHEFSWERTATIYSEAFKK